MACTRHLAAPQLDPTRLDPARAWPNSARLPGALRPEAPNPVLAARAWRR
jgi:hypothetical protein